LLWPLEGCRQSEVPIALEVWPAVGGAFGGVRILRRGRDGKNQHRAETREDAPSHAYPLECRWSRACLRAPFSALHGSSQEEAQRGEPSTSPSARTSGRGDRCRPPPCTHCPSSRSQRCGERRTRRRNGLSAR